MRKRIFDPIKTTILLSTFLFSYISHGQPNPSSQKDETRPEVTRQFNSPARISSFTAVAYNGYNEIQWSALAEQDTRKFIVEYSLDGINFQSAGEVLVTDGSYMLKHSTFETVPILYRMRIETMDGKFYYSRNILLDGVPIPPVKIFPTIITNNMVNIRAVLPIERVTVFSGSGQQLFTQEIGGKRDDMFVTLPVLGKGMYWMNFIGDGWKTTTTFIIP